MRILPDGESGRDRTPLSITTFFSRAASAYFNAGKHDGLLETCTGMNLRSGKKQGTLDRRARNHAATGQEGVGHLGTLAVY